MRQLRGRMGEQYRAECNKLSSRTVERASNRWPNRREGTTYTLITTPVSSMTYCCTTSIIHDLLLYYYTTVLLASVIHSTTLPLASIIQAPQNPPHPRTHGSPRRQRRQTRHACACLMTRLSHTVITCSARRYRVLRGGQGVLVSAPKI